MKLKSNIICPYLKGGTEGTICSLVWKFIRDIEEGRILVCMSKHYEVCSIYFTSLREMSLNSVGTEKVEEM